MDPKKTATVNSHVGNPKKTGSSSSNPAAAPGTAPSATGGFSSKSHHHNNSKTNGTASTRKRAMLNNTFLIRPRKIAKFHCEHLEKLKQEGGVVQYTKLCATFIHRFAKDWKKHWLTWNKCAICGRRDGFITACLECAYFACSRRAHFKAHVDHCDHSLGCDIRTGVIYCYRCCDIVFDEEFESILAHSSIFLNAKMAMAIEGEADTATVQVKSIAFDGSHWTSPITAADSPTLGFRGLLNLGHTCFMNCIVQVMIHTPQLRNFFLAEHLRCDEKHDNAGLKPCIVTDVCVLYQDFYSGNKEPLSLHALLHRMWGNAAHLAGYEQQDAHEFFIAMLDALHAHFMVGLDCHCIIDRIFLGKLQSSVVCTVCGHKSIKVDPFWDISLDLPTDGAPGGPVLTLTDCLNRYTRVEHLGGRIQCNFCKQNQPSTKQLKFKSLPYVLSLHFKRFEHRTAYKKIEQAVDFPEYLDLTEYTSANDELSSMATQPDIGGRLMLQNRSQCKYTLFGVVNHSGSMQGGHYTAFVRHSRGEWIKCDDHLLTKAFAEHVFRSQGYLLFYHKERIQYHDDNSSKARSDSD